MLRDLLLRRAGFLRLKNKFRRFAIAFFAGRDCMLGFDKQIVNFAH